jgi:CO/xanthine dehydrogenase FAD-binding subunit
MQPPPRLEIRAPDTLADALELKAANPGAVPLAGGTDLMVAINFRQSRPSAVLDLTRIPELREWAPDDGRVRVGAGVTYTRLIAELGDRLPGLALASRSVGSPQIRNRGTAGGNLATASPAGDALPPLYTSDAVLELASVRGTRHVPVAEFVTGPKRNGLEPDELIAAYDLPAAAGPQQFAKVGTRNAMVIAVCSVALALWPEQRRVAACVGSAGPTPLLASEAESFIAGVLDWDGGARPPDEALARFGELVGACARPIDDVRGTARYRSHAVEVLGRRTLSWAWSAYAAGARA